MADELPARAVAEASCRCEFLNLADVVEDCAGYQQIMIKPRIVLRQS